PATWCTSLALHDSLPILDEVGKVIKINIEELHAVVHDFAGLQRRSRHLNHAAESHFLIERNAAAAQLLLEEMAFGCMIEVPASADRKSTRLNSSHVSISY